MRLRRGGRYSSMEKFPSLTKLPENIESEIQEKISFAKDHALTEVESLEIDQKEVELEKICNERELTDDEVEHFFSFRERMNDATIRVSTLPEARRTMEILGFDADNLVDTLSHENAHANKAEQLGANHTGYNFIITETKDGRYEVGPQAVTSTPDDWLAEHKRHVEAQILQAPDEYGNKMSDSDKQKLKEIYKN